MGSNSHIRITFSLSLDITRNIRVAYSSADLVTETGGIISFLIVICSLVIRTFLRFETMLENKIMHNVFRRRLPNSTKLGYVNVNYRQYVIAVATACFCLRRPRHELWRRVAMRRLNRELDVTTFLKK